MSYDLILQFVRFCIVGLITTSLSYAVFLLLMAGMGMYHLLAGAAGFVSGALIGFFLNRRWTFGVDISLADCWHRYLAAQALSLGSHSAAQAAAISAGIPHEWTQLFGISVSTFVNFLLMRTYVLPNHGARA